MRNILRILISCTVVGLLVGAVGFRCTASAKVASFSIQILAPQTIVKSGSEVRLKIVLTNTSDHEIYMPKEKGAASGEFLYDIEVRDSQGKNATERKYYRALKGKEPDDATVVLSAPGLFGVKPGEALQDDVVLNKLFDLGVPGKYTVNVERLDEVSSVVVKSNTLTLTIAQ